jgi:2-oxoglutarate dehydrogenase E1 component
MTTLSYLSNAEPNAVQTYYELYQQNPTNVDITWQRFFEGFEFAQTHENNPTTSPNTSNANANAQKEFAVANLIFAYRHHAHLLSDTNPIRPRLPRDPGVALHYHHLTDADLPTQFAAGILIGLPNAPLNDIINRLKAIYTRAIGFEYMHIRNAEVREWCKQKFETEAHNYNFSIEKKRNIFTKINESVAFENFLHKKYVGQKRFSLEGGENTIPALEAIINKGAELGVKRFAIAMAHRGRLNVLANILGKTYEYIFNEFEGNYFHDTAFGDGDVKYHLGFSSHRKAANGENIYLSLMPNPSHLEAVSPVLLGYLRSKAEIIYNSDFEKVMPIIIHGDAALAGQGIVYEVAQMSELEGYKVGGALHFVINNQIGFTTDFYDARSSDYCTAVAKVTDSPVLHVNGDDAEAIVFAVEFATEFRQKFGKDVYVDMLCYRKHGHNESDEPKFTQPMLYNLIANHPNPREVYKQKLVAQGDLAASLVGEMEDNFNKLLQDRLDKVKQKAIAPPQEALSAQWTGIQPHGGEKDFEKSYQTKVKKENLEKIINALTHYPKDFSPIIKIEKLLKERAEKFKNDKLDWALGELLAYGTLLTEGRGVRISGQDVTRGTFSHRHAGIFDENTNQRYINLNNIADKQGKLSLYNSFLSEYAVLGFEYGYATASPNNLVIWEAQFGDFANGAQTMIDQFIAAGESKWNRMCGLVLLLPHGYEGQGPEHSNARPERFLQLAAEYNMVVANCTTPANMFHLLRRQLTWDFRKPLVVMSPKSLLRNPLCTSTVADLTDGQFEELIDDKNIKNSQKVRKVLLCTGKIYYDLYKHQTENKIHDVAIVRLEQIYPMPEKQLAAVYDKYTNAQFYWVQEEPKNMGAWTYMLRNDKNQQKLTLISRKASASPATGFAKVHDKEQAAIVAQSFA